LRARLRRAKDNPNVNSERAMAIYHLSAKIISRKAGRSSTAAAAYRACEQIVDRRTGEVHDFTRKRGLQSADLVMPSLVALPDELDAGQRRRLAVDFAQELADRYAIAADVAIHAPDQAGDNRNHHAHILTTTNRIENDGLGNKVRELDLVAHNMGGGIGKANEIEWIRTRWAELTNERLQALGDDARIDHRTLEAQGIERPPTQHLGPTATAIERRTGQPYRKRLDCEREIAERLTAAKVAGDLERQGQAADRSILDLSGDLVAAIAQRDAQEQQKRQAFQAHLDSGRADFRAKYEAYKVEKEQQRLAQLGRAEVERQRHPETEGRRQQIEREQERKPQQSQDRDLGFSR
jgi:hypothetical protein